MEVQKSIRKALEASEKLDGPVILRKERTMPDTLRKMRSWRLLGSLVFGRKDRVRATTDTRELLHVRRETILGSPHNHLSPPSAQRAPPLPPTNTQPHVNLKRVRLTPPNSPLQSSRRQNCPCKPQPAMADHSSYHGFHFLFLLALLVHLQVSRAIYPIGVNYGTVADNLLPPTQVAAFLDSNTTIDRVKIFDANPDILRAFSGTGIAVTITVVNGDITPLSKLPAAQSWVSSNVLPFHPATKINRIAVGNEIIATHDKALIAALLPAMRSLHSALQLANVTGVEVTTPHSLGILSSSEPPSRGRFRRGYDRAIFAPILKFHQQTKSAFMVNTYPYFGFKAKTLNYALFQPNSGVFDSGTGIKYTNMFDAQMDAVYMAMKRLGYGDVAIAVGETGWPSAGDPKTQPDANVENARLFNGNLVRHVNSGKGTPLMPNRTFETYVFALFNEDLKSSISEQNFGLFKPDLTPVYYVGILQDQQAAGPTPSSPAPFLSTPPASPASIAGRKWCKTSYSTMVGAIILCVYRFYCL